MLSKEWRIESKDQARGIKEIIMGEPKVYCAYLKELSESIKFVASQTYKFNLEKNGYENLNREQVKIVKSSWFMVSLIVG